MSDKGPRQMQAAATSGGQINSCSLCEISKGGAPVPDDCFYSDGPIFARYAPDEEPASFRITITTRAHRDSLAQLSGDEAAALGRTASLIASVVEDVAASPCLKACFELAQDQHVTLSLVFGGGTLQAGEREFLDALDREMFARSI